MGQLDDWFERIELAVAEAGSPVAASSQARWTDLWQRGFVAMLPLWRSSPHNVGLLAMPGTAPQEWPAIVEFDGEALTLASNSATALPMFLLLAHLAKAPRSAASLSTRWPEIGKRLLALHAVLGGDPEPLKGLVQAMGDARVREELASPDTHPEQFAARYGQLARQIDPSPRFSRYADWVEGSLRGHFDVPDPAAEYGPWARQTGMRAANWMSGTGGGRSLPEDLRADLLENFAGVDTGLPRQPGWRVLPGSGSSEANLSSLSHWQEAGGAKRDGKGMVEAIRREGMRYSGLTHAEAVPALAEDGELERAWGVLNSAAWWMARNIGEVPPSILAGARLLVRHRDWSDIGFVIEKSAQMRGVA